jgi:hypothetical protein
VAITVIAARTTVTHLAAIGDPPSSLPFGTYTSVPSARVQVRASEASFTCYKVGSGLNGVRVMMKRGSPYSENIRIESNWRMAGARKTAAVRFVNLFGTGRVTVAPSTYKNNRRLDSPTLACEGITGVTGSDGRC